MSRRIATFSAVVSCVVVACSALTDVGDLASEAGAGGSSAAGRGGASGGAGGSSLGGAAGASAGAAGAAGAGAGQAGQSGAAGSDSAGAAGTSSAGAAGSSAGAPSGGSGGAGGGGAAGSAGSPTAGAGGSTSGTGGASGSAGAAGSAGTAGSAGAAGSSTVFPCDTDTVGDGIFVSPTGDESAAGSAETPVRSIARALERLVTQKKTTIYVEEGAYGEGILLDASFGRPVLIDGGWRRNGSSWQRLCGDTAQATTVQSPTGRALSVIDSSGLVRVRHLTLSTAIGDSGPVAGRSHYGVFATGSISAPVNLELEDVIVAPGPGENGEPAPAAPTADTASCDGRTDCANGLSGSPGNESSVGTPAPGTFNASGYLAPSPIDGAPGTPGKNGVKSEPMGASYTSCETQCVGPIPCSIITETKEVPGGTCGCGGLGGKGGPGGRAGGASVGIFASASVTVKVIASRVQPSSGGAGTAPGTPAAGGIGSDGIATPPTCCAATCEETADGECLFHETSPCPVGAVRPGLPAGQKGGDGGPGAVGKGGVGGPSVCVVTRGGAIANVGESVALVPGSGGSAGPNGGLAGDAKPFLNLP